MSSIQQGYEINPGASPTKWQQLKVDVSGIELDKVNELQARLEEFRISLESEIAKYRMTARS